MIAESASHQMADPGIIHIDFCVLRKTKKKTSVNGGLGCRSDRSEWPAPSRCEREKERERERHVDPAQSCQWVSGAHFCVRVNGLYADANGLCAGVNMIDESVKNA